MIELFIKGLIVGAAISVPLGPLGVLCIQRTLSKGKISGIMTGAGASIADLIYSAIALLGLSFINQFITTYEEWFMLTGGIIVIIFGLITFFVNPIKQIRRADAKSQKHVQDFFSSLLMTLSNPGALFLVITGLAIVGIENRADGSIDFIASITLLGIFLGGMLWWWTLASLINHFRTKFRLRQLLAINKISGVIILALGIISAFEGLFRIVMQQ